LQAKPADEILPVQYLEPDTAQLSAK
jgi:hypothetical protein